MSTVFSTFERLKEKGVKAYRQGEYAAARSYLIEAAECMIELAEQAKTPQLRQQQETYAAELIELAKKCEQNKKSGSPARQRAGENEDEDQSASEWIVREKPNIGFDDIAGLENVKNEIRLKMIYPLQHRELAAKYGINPGGGVLLYGPPGTGKTMMAKAIAFELQATFFLVSPADILSKWVGEAEQNLKKLFEAARAEPQAIIFMDEIEALTPRREGHGSSVMQRVVPQILQELEGFGEQKGQPLLFLGATNKPWLLDEAMRRPGRFDTMIYVPLPDAPARFKLLEINLADKPLAEDVNFGPLCDMLDGYSGADITHIAEVAARQAFLESIAGQQARTIIQQDIINVIQATPPSVKAGDLERFVRFQNSGQ
ncbi:MAG: ATP-dependent zinc metalloprotease FtsH [Phycisphaerae bacterium]|nr:ATP-dependent zinc metalloprotease FtsH [Phycisphaerae bacterium]